MRLCEIPRPWRERALAGSLSGITGGENKFSLERKKKRKEVKTRKRRGKKSSQPRTIEWRWSCTLRWTRVELRRVYLDGLEVKAPNGCEYIVAINSTKSEYSRSSGDWSDHFSEKPAGSFLCTESTRWEAARDEKIKEKRYVAPPPRHPYLSQHRI